MATPEATPDIAPEALGDALAEHYEGFCQSVAKTLAEDSSMDAVEAVHDSLTTIDVLSAIWAVAAGSYAEDALWDLFDGCYEEHVAADVERLKP